MNKKQKRKQDGFFFLAALLAAGLGGCSVMNTHQPVPGWPQLKVVEHHVPHAEMRDRCARFVSPFSSPEGCTLFYFDRREAHIYVSGELPTPGVLEHERLHAAGYDHVGSTNMLRVLRAWRATRQVAASKAKAAADFTF
jgi:hypothetical protein